MWGGGGGESASQRPFDDNEEEVSDRRRGSKSPLTNRYYHSISPFDYQPRREPLYPPALRLSRSVSLESLAVYPADTSRVALNSEDDGG
jgi:hypothetical protein